MTLTCRTVYLFLITQSVVSIFQIHIETSSFSASFIVRKQTLVIKNMIIGTHFLDSTRFIWKQAGVISVSCILVNCKERLSYSYANILKCSGIHITSLDQHDCSSELKYHTSIRSQDELRYLNNLWESWILWQISPTVWTFLEVFETITIEVTDQNKEDPWWNCLFLVLHLPFLNYLIS